MADADEAQDVTPKKQSKKPLFIGFILAAIFAAAGFYATWSGLILGGDVAHSSDDTGATPLPDLAFVPIEPLVVSLGPGQENRHLRFTSQLEVNSKHSEEVNLLLPRIIDVMNGYLRAIDVAEFDDPAALVRMRAQLLRRVQIVTGDGRVRDLLITEFLLN